MAWDKVLEESTTYQWILEQGEAKGVARGRIEGLAESRIEGRIEGMIQAGQDFIILIGSERFGAPPPGIDSTLRTVTDWDRLRRIVDRLLDATGWDDLLATP